MGKSNNNDIKISDNEKTTEKKLMRAITDRTRIKKDDLGHPELCEVVYKYWEIFGDEATVSTVACECKAGQRGCADCKRALAKVINEKFAPIREKRRYYEEHISEVEDILREGSNKAREEAKKVLADVRELVRMY